MKTHKYIFEKVASMENITAAIYKASENKRSRPEVIAVLKDPEKHAYQIYKMLWTKSYTPCVPVESSVKEGASQKERIVTKICFYPDQIIHWAIVLQLQKIIMKSSYSISCGCMPGRGVHYGKKFMERWIRKDRKNTKYCSKMDIKKFYPSIKHDVAKKHLKTIIKDPKMIWLLDSIIKSYSPGLPIGFLTSQWIANFILQKLDYFIKQKLKVKYYLRYMDDLVLLGANKKKLHKAVREIESFLKEDSFRMKENWQVFRVDKRAVDVMGFRFFRHKTILRKSLMFRISRKMNTIWKKGMATPRDACAVVSYMGWIKHADVRDIFNTRVVPYVSIKRMKQIIRKFSRGELKKHESSPVRKRKLSYIT